MHIALSAARRKMKGSSALSLEDIDEIHLESYFAGSMRRNLVRMLDAIGIHEYLAIETTSLLFGRHHRLMHATSIFKYPVFNRFNNYTGYSPSPIASPFLLSMIETTLTSELSDFRNCIAIPLGRVASLCLDRVKNITNGIYIVNGFPHPSSANGHRLKQFRANYDYLRAQISDL
jgi:hypothetical protein